MTTYNSYEEAKIANPDSDIYLDYSVFRTWNHDQIASGTKCDPSKYCMTVEKFLADGHKFVKGDVVLNAGGKVISLTKRCVISEWDGSKCPNDDKRYILRAAALNKPKRTKVEYVKVTDSIFDLRPDFEAGELLTKKAWGEYKVIESEDRLAVYFELKNLYRRIETEIDERQEFIDAYGKIRNDFANQSEVSDFCEFMCDSGRFKLVEGE